MMEQFRVMIVDDERYARDELRYLLEDFPRLSIVGEADSGEKAIMKALQLKPDVVFLDIEMPKMNGIDVATSLKEMKKSPLIVFATAYPQFAAEAFRINAIHYLLKPYDREEITQAVQRIHHELFPEPHSDIAHGLGRIAVEKDGEIDYVAIENILYMSPEGKQTKIITKDHEYLIKSSLKDLEQRLTSHSFFRVHRSYLVNLIYVTRLTPWFNGAYHIELEGITKQLPVSRNYVKKLREKLEK